MMIIDVVICAIQITYCQGPYDEASGFANLQETLQGFETAASAKTVGRLFYLALPPQVYPDVLSNIKQHCSDFSSGDGDCVPETWLRVVIEKPFGHDLASSEELSDTVAGLFAEQQIYRIDHFLGKEVTQVRLASCMHLRVACHTPCPQQAPQRPQPAQAQPSNGGLLRSYVTAAVPQLPRGRYVLLLSEGPRQSATSSPCYIKQEGCMNYHQHVVPAAGCLHDGNTVLAVYAVMHVDKEACLQNMLVMRFGNLFLSSVWSRQHIDNIQIVMKEAFGTEGRGGYFDKFGIIRDVIQNHLLQVRRPPPPARPSAPTPHSPVENDTAMYSCMRAHIHAFA